MAQGYKGEIPFHELCRYIYEGFNQYALVNLIHDRQREGYLQDVRFFLCEPCENEMPFEYNTCLVCGTKRRNNNE